jgi:hypothetical protein
MRDLVSDLSDRQHMVLISEEEKAADIDRKKRMESLPANSLHGVSVGGIKTIAKMSARNDAEKGDDNGKKDDWVAAKLKILECREIQANGLSCLEKTCTGVTVGITELRSMLESSLRLFLISDELMSLLDAFGCIEMFQKNKKEISRGVIVKKFLTCLKRLIDNLRDEQRQKVKKEHEKAVVVRIKNSDTSSSSSERIKKSAAAAITGGGSAGGSGVSNSDVRIKRNYSENNSSRTSGSDGEKVRNISPTPSDYPVSAPVPESILSLSEPRLKTRGKEKDKEKENGKESSEFPISKERGNKSRSTPTGKEIINNSSKSDTLILSSVNGFSRERKKIVSGDGNSNCTNHSNKNSQNNNNNNSNSNYSVATQSNNSNNSNQNQNHNHNNIKARLPPPPTSSRYPNPSFTPGSKARKSNITPVSTQEKESKGQSKYGAYIIFVEFMDCTSYCLCLISLPHFSTSFLYLISLPHFSTSFLYLISHPHLSTLLSIKHFH